MIKNYRLALIPVLFAISCGQPAQQDNQSEKKAVESRSDVSTDASAEVEANSKPIAVTAEASADAQAMIELFLDDTAVPKPGAGSASSKLDIEAIVSSRAKAAAQCIVDRFDKDKSGAVTLEEFLAIAASSPLDKLFKVEKTPEQIAEIKKVLTEKFNKIAGGSEITAAKLESSIKAQFENMKKLVAERTKEISGVVMGNLDGLMLPKADSNGDGKVDAAELQAFKTSIVDWRREQLALRIEGLKKAIEGAIAAKNGGSGMLGKLPTGKVAGEAEVGVKASVGG